MSLLLSTSKSPNPLKSMCFVLFLLFSSIPLAFGSALHFDKDSGKTFVIQKYTQLAVGGLANANITYQSSDLNVATVNSISGEVTPKSAGFVTITATQKKAKARYKLWVIDDRFASKDIAWDDLIDYSLDYTVENNVNGDLKGQLWFHQSQMHRPSAKKGEIRPLITAYREAYLLFTPEANNTLESLKLTVTNNKDEIFKTALLPPKKILKSNQNNTNGAYLAFSKRSWTATIPWDFMTSGMSITITQNDGLGNKQAYLSKGQIEVGNPHEITLYNIDVGMLISPRAHNRNVYKAYAQKGAFAIDYFQKVPIAKYTVASYAPAYFPKIVMSSGKTYTASSDGNGGYHSGDMRADIAKKLISDGINYANIGQITSNSQIESVDQKPMKITTAHTARGKYKNGIITHGLSGGGGRLTLVDLSGNEFSHEYGHEYGLGHYPGGQENFRHAYGDGWSYDPWFKRLVANFRWGSAKAGSADGYDSEGNIIPKRALYNGYNYDAMAGGSPTDGYAFTTHTLYSSSKIQNNLSYSGIPDSSSATGYSYWDKNTGEYKDLTVKYAKPTGYGVPVMTLVGYYDPRNELTTFIYPPLYANHGNYFTSSALNEKNEDDTCRLIVYKKTGTTDTYNLTPYRYNAYSMNRFQLNLPGNGSDYEKATVECKSPSFLTSSPITIPGFDESKHAALTSITADMKGLSLGAGALNVAATKISNSRYLVQKPFGIHKKGVFIEKKGNTLKVIAARYCFMSNCSGRDVSINDNEMSIAFNPVSDGYGVANLAVSYTTTSEGISVNSEDISLIRNNTLDTREITPLDFNIGKPVIVGKEYGMANAASQMKKFSDVFEANQFHNHDDFITRGFNRVYPTAQDYNEEKAIITDTIYKQGSKYYIALTSNIGSPSENSTGWFYLGDSSNGYIGAYKDLELGSYSENFTEIPENTLKSPYILNDIPVGNGVISTKNASGMVWSWYTNIRYSEITAEAINIVTGDKQPINLRGQLRGNNALNIGQSVGWSARNAARIYYQKEDNLTLPPGSYYLEFIARGHSWHNHKLKTRLRVFGKIFKDEPSIDIKLENFTKDFSLLPENTHKSPYIFNYIPLGNGVISTKNVSGRVFKGQTPYSEIKVEATNTSTGEKQAINLRGQLRENNALNIGQDPGRSSRAKFYYDSSDNKTLLPGTYAVAFVVKGHAWNNPRLKMILRITGEIFKDKPSNQYR